MSTAWEKDNRVSAATRSVELFNCGREAGICGAQRSLVSGQHPRANSRETLRDGLIRVGAVVERSGLPTTSSKPRYALREGFAALFDLP